MALSIDSSPVRRFMQHLVEGASPEVWFWQVGIAIVAVALGWSIARATFHRVKPSARWKFGEGDFERVRGAVEDEVGGAGRHRMYRDRS